MSLIFTLTKLLLAFILNLNQLFLLSNQYMYIQSNFWFRDRLNNCMFMLTYIIYGSKSIQQVVSISTTFQHKICSCYSFFFQNLNINTSLRKFNIGIQHDCESMNHITSTEKPLQHSRLWRLCCEECFITIITHTCYKMLFIQSYISF